MALLVAPRPIGSQLVEELVVLESSLQALLRSSLLNGQHNPGPNSRLH